MDAAQLPGQLHTKCYCPSCGRQLVLSKCADPWAVCLICEDGQRFFVLPEAPNAADSARAASLHFPQISGLSVEAIASFWLSQPVARSKLNQQLARILRAILEARSVLDQPRFSFCPICGRTFEGCDHSDIWAKELRCRSGHSWALRGFSLFAMIGATRLELQAEYTNAVISQLIANWLKGNSYLEPNLHESVRRVLISSPLCPRDEHA